jgi:hypothetical protein
MWTALLHRAALAGRIRRWSSASRHPTGRRAFLAIPLLVPLQITLFIPLPLAARVAAPAGARPVERAGWILDASDR